MPHFAMRHRKRLHRFFLRNTLQVSPPIVEPPQKTPYNHFFVPKQTLARNKCARRAECAPCAHEHSFLFHRMSGHHTLHIFSYTSENSRPSPGSGTRVHTSKSAPPPILIFLWGGVGRGTRRWVRNASKRKVVQKSLWLTARRRETVRGPCVEHPTPESGTWS